MSTTQTTTHVFPTVGELHARAKTIGISPAMLYSFETTIEELDANRGMPTWATGFEIIHEDRAVRFVGTFGIVKLTASVLFEEHWNLTNEGVSVDIGGTHVGEFAPEELTCLLADLTTAAAALESGNNHKTLKRPTTATITIAEVEN